ncbi:hypothetical protein M5585_16230 [Serratia ureilytica]
MPANWSTMQAVSGTGLPLSATSPKWPMLSLTSGKLSIGTPNKRHSSSSHCRVWMLNNEVREAEL